jgi:hypothetical protein
MKAVVIELKDATHNNGNLAEPDGLRQRAGMPAFENGRATAWILGPGSVGNQHRHLGDAVEVIFDGATPVVSFVPRGTLHASPNLTDMSRMVVFEIK